MNAVRVDVAPRVNRNARGVAMPVPDWRLRVGRAVWRAPAGLLFGTACLAMVLGLACLTTSIEDLVLPMVGLLAVALVLLTSSVYGELAR